MALRRIPHPSGAIITFDAKWHQYNVNGKQRLKSVSKLLDKHFPFDEKRVSELVSRKTGQSTTEVLASWKRQALLGKNVHAFIESQLLAVQDHMNKAKGKNGVTVPPPNYKAFLSGITDAHGEEEEYLKVAQDAVQRVIDKYDILAVEKIIASPRLGLAGTIDFVGRNKATGGILIGDWKTSGSVTSPFRFGSFETPATGCLGHLPNGKFYRYAMQVITYGHILQVEGYEKELMAGAALDKLEYGIVQMSKSEDGNVIAEYKDVSWKTVMPLDRELNFSELLNQLLVE